MRDAAAHHAAREGRDTYVCEARAAELGRRDEGVGHWVSFRESGFDFSIGGGGACGTVRLKRSMMLDGRMAIH